MLTHQVGKWQHSAAEGEIRNVITGRYDVAFVDGVGGVHPIAPLEIPLSGVLVIEVPRLQGCEIRGELVIEDAGRLVPAGGVEVRIGASTATRTDRGGAFSFRGVTQGTRVLSIAGYSLFRDGQKMFTLRIEVPGEPQIVDLGRVTIDRAEGAVTQYWPEERPPR
jgi:hypothetical protein